VPGFAGHDRQFRPHGQPQQGKSETSRFSTLNGQSVNDVTTYAYDLDGNVHSTTTSTDSATLTATNAYDDLNRLLSLVNTGTTGNVISSYGYQYDAVGDITQVNEVAPGGTATTTKYTYDALNRLTDEQVLNASGTVQSDTSYDYDLAGNRFSQTDASGTTYFYYYSENPEELRAQVTPDHTETDFYYDANGSLITTALNNNGTPTVTASYTYDDRNRLVSATVNGQSISYTYDDDGNRVSSTTASGTTLYENDEQSPTGYSQVLAEKSASGSIQAVYAWGLQLVAQSRPASGTSFYLYDGHGSVRALANTSGTVTDTYTYDAFGNLTSPQSSTPNVYRYSGQRWDSILGQYDLRARNYDPTTGRFTSMDDPRFATVPGGLGNANAYAYGAGNPVNFVDPSGNFIEPQALGYQAHALFAAYVLAKGINTIPEAPLFVVLPNLFPAGSPEGFLEPDVVDRDARAFYELKPISWRDDPRRTAALETQLGLYIGALGPHGYVPGNSAALAPRGTVIGDTIDPDDGKAYEIVLEPSALIPGAIFYYKRRISDNDWNNRTPIVIPIPNSIKVKNNQRGSIRLYNPQLVPVFAILATATTLAVAARNADAIRGVVQEVIATLLGVLAPGL
jgi:RHS repeat-associated protein